MPTYTFSCGFCDWIDVEIVNVDERNTVRPCPRCVRPYYARVQRLSAVPTIGPVWDKGSELERHLLSPRERAAGKRITSLRDLRRIEREKGLGERVDPTSRSYGAELEDMEDHAATRRRVYEDAGGDENRREASDAVMDWETRETITSDTGMSTADYIKWQGLHAQATKLAAEKPSVADTPTNTTEA